MPSAWAHLKTSASAGKQRWRLFNQFSPKLSHLVGVGRAHAAVHLNPWVGSLLVAHPAQLADLLHLVLDELLAAKAGVDCRQSGRTRDSASFPMQHMMWQATLDAACTGPERQHPPWQAAVRMVAVAHANQSRVYSPLISRMRSTWEMTYWIVLRGVAGFSTTPAFTPRSLICSRGSHATQTCISAWQGSLVKGWQLLLQL